MVLSPGACGHLLWRPQTTDAGPDKYLLRAQQFTWINGRPKLSEPSGQEGPPVASSPSSPSWEFWLNNDGYASPSSVSLPLDPEGSDCGSVPSSHHFGVFDVNERVPREGLSSPGALTAAPCHRPGHQATREALPLSLFSQGGVDEGAGPGSAPGIVCLSLKSHECSH